MEEPIITHHAYDQAKNRLSLSKGAFKALAKRAYYNGLSKRDINGRLFRYLEQLYHAHKGKANNVKIYGENAFLFHDNILLTVFKLQLEMARLAVVLQAKRKKDHREVTSDDRKYATT